MMKLSLIAKSGVKGIKPGKYKSSQLAASESYVPIQTFIVDFYTFEAGSAANLSQMLSIFVYTFAAVSPVPSLYTCGKFLCLYTSEENLYKCV